MNSAVHPLQSPAWGEFRRACKVRVVRTGGVQVSIHNVPGTPWKIGYAPKIARLDGEVALTLDRIARDHRCIFVKCEPWIEKQAWAGEKGNNLKELGFVEGRPLFPKYNFVLDLKGSEAELRAGFKPKTRYNIKIAEKHGVVAGIDNSPAAFERYLELTEETTRRQGFFAHDRAYHRKMWEVMHAAGIAQLLVARYQGEILTTWVLFRFGDTLYYPYGASSRQHREVMANHRVMWEAIRLARQWGLRRFDLWGALGPDPDPRDPWYGFHKFKQGYSPRHVEYLGTWDYVAKPGLYPIFRWVENLRRALLRVAKTVRAKRCRAHRSRH